MMRDGRTPADTEKLRAALDEAGVVVQRTTDAPA
jgi:hypothetical protein